MTRNGRSSTATGRTGPLGRGLLVGAAFLVALGVGVRVSPEGAATVAVSTAEAQGARTMLRNSSRVVRDAIRNQIRQALTVRLRVQAPPRAEVQRVEWSSDGTMAAALLADGSGDVWFLDQGATLRLPVLGAPPFRDVVLSPGGGGLVAVIDRDDRVAIATLGAPARRGPTDFPGGRPVALTPRGDRAGVLVSTVGGTVVEIGVDGSARRLWSADGGTIDGIDADSDGDRVVVHADGRVVELAIGPSGPATVEETWRLTGVRDVVYAASGPVALLDDGSVHRLSSDGARSAADSPVSGDRLLASDDGAFAVLTDDGDGAVWPGTGNARPARFAIGAENVAAATLTPGAALVMVRRENGWVDGHDVATAAGGRVLRMVATRSGWAAVDSRGRYDGSLGALTEVGWGDDGTFIELERFAELYFEPGLVRRYLARRRDFLTAPPEPIVDDTEIAAPPEVSVSVDRAPATAGQALVASGSVTSPEPVVEVRVFHNGRALPPEAVVTGTSDDGGVQTVTVTTDTQASEGENTLQVVAQTESGLVTASDVQTVTVAPPPAPPPAPRLVVKSFGINDYASPELKLNFAAADAEAIADRFSRSEVFEPSYRTKDVYLDSNAGRSTILGQMQSLQSLGADDMAVIFLSGHGVATPDLGDWYFLPYEARSLSDLDHIAGVGISDGFLVSAITDLEVDRVLLMIDSCQSGVVADEFSRYRQRRSLKRIADRTGIQILTATRPDQLALEVRELGHGLFAYVVLAALDRDSRGRYRADLGPIDGRVSVAELRSYVETNVPVVAQTLMEAMGRSGQGTQVASAASTRTRGGAGTSVVMPVSAAYGRNFTVY